MAIVVSGGLDTPLPRMVPVKQKFEAPVIEDIQAAMESELSKPEIRNAIRPGDRVAVGVGSRGIAHLKRMTAAIIRELLKWGARPFIVPAMGSHGGATGEGQKQVLAEYGITEESMQVPIVSSMDVSQIGRLDCGMPVYLDQEAARADAIIFINRVKPHTSFKGDYESGLLKMMAIGLGRHAGATALHQRPLADMPRLLPQMAQMYIQKAPIKFGVAVLENAYDQTAKIEAIPADQLIAREKQLLMEAKAYMPRLLPAKIDVLIVSEIGKNISGSGMDPNITGRAASKAPQTFNAPDIERMVVLGLTPETKGNACGIGVADVTTEKVFRSINLEYMYANVITSKVLASAKIPLIMPNDRDAIRVTLKTCYAADVEQPRLVWIKNTLALGRIWVSEALIPEVEQHDRMEVVGHPREIIFDERGYIKEDLWEEANQT